MSDLPIIKAGDYHLAVRCPECKKVSWVKGSITAVLTVDETSSSLRAKLTTKKVDHVCDKKQQTLFEPPTVNLADATGFLESDQ